MLFYPMGFHRVLRSWVKTIFEIMKLYKELVCSFNLSDEEKVARLVGLDKMDNLPKSMRSTRSRSQC